MLATALIMTTGACAGHRTAGETISDASITASVKTRLLADTRTDGLKIDVDTQSGVVYLSGEVDSSEQVTAAVNIAKQVDGVSSVENNLLVTQMKN
jgi:osmotically-inducible protein OsmY